MSNSHRLERVRVRDGHALKAYCIHDKRCSEIREHGDHVIACGPKGSAVFPDREMGTGLWRQVIKTMIAIGLGMLALMFLVVVF